MILLELFLGFLQVGLFAFGGAYGAIPLIRDVVLSYGWIEEEMLTVMIAVSESTPGPIMVNLATYVGSVKAGILGAMVATLAVVLPSFVIILLVTISLQQALKNPYVQAVLRGMKPCIIGIILATGAYMMLRNGILFQEKNMDLRPLLLTLGLSGTYFGSRKLRKGGISPILFICLAAVCGVLVYR
ncbi:MAG: chromate transporter [Blautia sp.]|nr:chromate transporter [Blautia sp.]